MKRRDLLQLGIGCMAASTLPRALAATPRFTRDPFTLGVASGYPTASTCVLWTRLAPEPLAPGGGMDPVVVPVYWEVATADDMQQVVRTGTTYATPDWGHSVHVEVFGLQPDRPYWYRFRAGAARSPVGRLRTASATSTSPARLRLAVASCQHYEQGYFTAYQHMVQDQPDLILHVGDYIYETTSTVPRVRQHEAGEPYTLDDYRARYALYRSDPQLQAAHAACPWLVVWDDHEVDNDYAADLSEQDDDPALFVQRRAAAYRAFYEHMPVPRQAVAFGPNLRLYAQRTFGDLLNVLMLDERQYRSPQACSAPGQRGARSISACAELGDPARSMLGARQEAWLTTRLTASQATWNLLAQGVMMAHVDELPGVGERFWNDAWTGYPAARQRLLDSLQETRVSNPVILSGDIHAFVASDVSAQPERPETPVVASELVTTSITSNAMDEHFFRDVLPGNPNTKLATGLHRGYLRLDVTAAQLRADMIAMETVRQPTSTARVLQSFVLESGRRGLQSV